MRSQVTLKSHNAGIFVFVCVAIVAANSVFAQSTGSETSRIQHAAADSMQSKIDFIKANSTASPVNTRPITFNQTEINAYFAERRLKMPEGIQSATFDLATGEVTANTRVDFDAITASARSYHPLLAIFSGIHDVQVIAEASGTAHTVHVKVMSATIDGISVPKMALQMFIEKWVNPKYPTIRLNGDYALPARIDSVSIESRRGVITQR